MPFMGASIMRSGTRRSRERPVVDLDREIEDTLRILEAARAAGAVVVLSTSYYDEALDDAGPWSLKVPSSEWLIEGTEWV